MATHETPNDMQVIYYAHCQAIYNTPQEERDIAELERLGFSVGNPNKQEIDAAVKRFKEAGEPYMHLFRDIIQLCDALAFRALPDGAIPSGVYAEIEFAREFGLPVIELPSSVLRRGLTVEQTRQYICEVGKR